MQSASDLWLAAEQRLLDARKLTRGGSRGVGAIYLAGYVVEMVLKGAYFQIPTPAHSFPAGGDVEGFCRYPAGRGGVLASAPVPEWDSSYFGARPRGHDLFGWLQLVAARRSVAGVTPIPPNLFGEVVAVASLWSVDARYSPDILAGAAARATVRAAGAVYNDREKLIT